MSDKINIDTKYGLIVYTWDDDVKYWIAFDEPFFSSAQLTLSEEEMNEIIYF